MENIVTPVRYAVLEDLLLASNYNKEKTQFLVEGFREGFKLKYDGKLKDCKRLAPNLKLRVGSKLELWNKVMNEVKL